MSSNLESENIFFHSASSDDEMICDHSASNVLQPRIILVCFLCLRQYDLEEDLRGHMIEYHKYKLKNEPAKENATEDKEKPKADEIKVETKTSTAKGTEPADNKVTISEMKPMPFKDFRLILRSNMLLKCNKYSNCIYKFETAEKLKQHLDCHSSNKTAFQCFKCAIELKNWRCCSEHLWKAHKLDVDLLKCPICTFQSHASALVWRHMRVHKKWRPRVMRSLKAIKKRREEALKQKECKLDPSTPKPIPAPKKNKYYSEKTCEICERKFVNGKTLSKHIKTVHNKIKPFNCNVCGKKTARKASLIIHMRQHTGEKPLSCKSCKFSTRDPSVLHKHQMRHERVGQLKCSQCDYTCIQSNALKRHIRLKHSDFYKQISCDLCSFVTINVNKLKAHKEDHRKGLIAKNDDSMANQTIVKNEASADCFLPLESIDSLPHEPAVDTGGVTIPAPSEDSQFPTYLNN